MGRRSLAEFARWCGVLLVSALTLALAAPGAAAQSATIRARATVVRPAVPPAVLDTAVLRAAFEAATADATTQLPGGVQVRRVETRAAVREVRVEYVAN